MHFETTDDIYAFMIEREENGATLYRFASLGVADREAKGLLEKLAQRCDAYRERLRQSQARGVFETRKCTLPDRDFASTVEPLEVGPEARLVDVIIFAISKEEIDYSLCREGAQRAKKAEVKKLWLALAEEERRQRLELEEFYEKEVISKI